MRLALEYCGTDLRETNCEAATHRQFPRTSRTNIKIIVTEFKSESIVDVLDIVHVRSIHHRKGRALPNVAMTLCRSSGYWLVEIGFRS
jgi:hypothetical protein